ncbi:hypothetical protein ES319_A08G087800v1 [Gossypium barbadense]|uniref:Secreted protein n=1 Tax=Gossypium barbadense TaxID=3634 RepID=A0A5J5UNH4_GOSBA|nr:hypothetical protein ES319_A08G087800v1 [Gossypium barbadense]
MLLWFLVAFSSFACLQVHGESTDEGVSTSVQGESTLGRNARWGTWVVAAARRRLRNPKVSELA